MKLTSAMASKMIKALNEENQTLIHKRRHESTTSYVQDEIPLESDYDFNSLHEQIVANNKKIAKIRHAVNLFNTTTVLEGFEDYDGSGLTIDKALIIMPMLSSAKDAYSKMKDANDISRRVDYKGNVEFTKLNYLTSDVATAYQKVTELLTAIQLSLDKANLTVEFEVDIS